MYPNLRIIRIENTNSKFKSQKSPPEAPACRQAGILLRRKNYNSKIKTLIIGSHCEERSDEAISKMNYEFLTCLPAGRF